jgi:hypothetical protein
MGFGVMDTPTGPHPGLAVVTQGMLAQLVFACGLETHPAVVAQAVVGAQADLHPLAWPLPHRQSLPSAPQMHPLVVAQETFLLRQSPLKQLEGRASPHAVLPESTQAALGESAQADLQESTQPASPVAQADAQLVFCQENIFAPLLQPGNPANSSKAAGARAIHRLKAIMRNTPLNWSSRHSVQNGHAGAIRAKTGD